jgi:decaprenylphospho-beta-D-ribofuranose 2-oxidase
VALEKKRFVSFDGGAAVETEYQHPDRYRQLAADFGSRWRIAQGGGYSYAAASFGTDCVVQKMTQFNRVLGFMRDQKEIEVEAGMTVGDLVEITAKAGLWNPVIPGYPAITIGGCIAADVHGKNPTRDGTFRNWVKSLVLYHPSYDTQHISPKQNPVVFDLTCGGYGLTGIIVSAVLRLEPLPGLWIREHRVPVGSLGEALEALRAPAANGMFSYSMHYAVPSKRFMGRGFVYAAEPIADQPQSEPVAKNAFTLSASTRQCLPFSLWGGKKTFLFILLHWLKEKRKGKVRYTTLFDSVFPLARQPAYFLAYGRRGLMEYQAIIPDTEINQFILEIQKKLLQQKPPAVMCSLKLFRGKSTYLRFAKDGICIAIDFLRSTDSEAFLSSLDSMTAEAGGIPNIIKDSRLPCATVSKCYSEYQRLRQDLKEYDPQRLYHSELSERLEL